MDVCRDILILSKKPWLNASCHQHLKVDLRAEAFLSLYFIFSFDINTIKLQLLLYLHLLFSYQCNWKYMFIYLNPTYYFAIIFYICSIEDLLFFCKLGWELYQPCLELIFECSMRRWQMLNKNPVIFQLSAAFCIFVWSWSSPVITCRW